jgi:hypothetical protein
MDNLHVGISAYPPLATALKSSFVNSKLFPLNTGSRYGGKILNKFKTQNSKLIFGFGEFEFWVYLEFRVWDLGFNIILS